MQYSYFVLLCFSISTKFEIAFGASKLEADNLLKPLRNLTGVLHPNKWQEHWIDHNEELYLMYSDKYVAFYFDSFMQTTVFNYSYQVLSDAWRYATNTYGPFVTNSTIEGSSPNPTLNFVLHQGKHFGCRLSNYDSYLDPQFDFRLTIDCGAIRWHDALLILIKEVGNIIQLLAKATGNFPGKTVSKLKMRSILVYDIFKGIGRHDDAKNWLESYLVKTSSEEFSTRKTWWFRDWFYPIYTKFGGTSVLNNFFNKLALFWPRKENGRDYDGQMNQGELIHFWSGAAKQDLNGLAVRAFGWTAEDYAQLENATRQFSQLNYSRETDNLFLPPKKWNVTRRLGKTLLRTEIFHSYSDDHVAFYTNLNSTNSTLKDLQPFPLPHKILSKGWEYSKATYGPFGADPILYIIVREVDISDQSVECTFSKRNSYFDTDYDNRNVIDCRISSNLRYKSSLQINELLVHPLMEIMGGTILRNYGETGNWLALNISGWSFQTIFAYDIFFGGGASKSTNTSDTQKWLQQKFVDKTWFDEWYFPLYKSYGGSVLLKNFLSALHPYWPKKEHNYVKEMKLGVFVHFWSGAAETNLWYFAANAFGWNLEHHQCYINSVSLVSHLKYADTYPNTTIPIPTLTWKESWNGQKEDLLGQLAINEPMEEHREELNLAYIDQHVAIYFDLEVEPAITWPFKPLSDAWKYVQKYLGPFGPDPILYIVLHEGSHSRCMFTRLDIPTENIPSTNITAFSNRIIIDCGQSYGGWSKPNLLKQLISKIANIIQRGTKEIANCPFKEIGSIPDLLLFDILYGIGRKEDAVNHLKENNYLREFQYPMYALYGRTSVLKNFFTLLQAHWPKGTNGCGYAKQLTAGDFYHFWSGATGVNLKYLDKDWWFEDFERLFQKARMEYPVVKYNESTAAQTIRTNPLLLDEYKSWFGHDELLFLDYDDKYIAIYTDIDLHLAIDWPLELLAHTWRQIQNTYKLTLTHQSPNASLPKQYLYVILHERRSHSKCEILSSDKSITKTTPKINLAHVIDCGKGSSGWTNESEENKYNLIEALSSVILKIPFLKETYNRCEIDRNISMNNNKDCRVYLKSPQIERIIVYDIYLRAGRFKDAFLLLQQCIHQADIKSKKEILWMRNWYLPIYTNYGGVASIDKYLSILSTSGSAFLVKQGRGNFDMKLNNGENVHFWSGAVGENLIQVGAFAFGWTGREENQFNEARNKLPSLRYSCYDCGLPRKEPQKEILNGFAITSAIAILIAFLILFLFHRIKIRKLEEQIRQLTSEEIQEFFEGTAKDCGENVYMCAESAPFNMDYEISKDKLVIDSNHVLGSGQFGLVLYATMEDKPVAVKTVNSDVDITSFKTLLAELKVICFLGRHVNIVSLIGAVTVNIQNRELFIAMEFCAKGDLLSYIHKHREDFVDIRNQTDMKDTPSADVNLRDYANVQIETGPNELPSGVYLELRPPDDSLSHTSTSFFTLDLLEWAIQISHGMNYISSKNVIHGDLAARNILLSADNVAKISDFGLSRQLANYSNYKKKSQTPVPWRWMAIESLLDMNFSVESDVWSFGVLLYEIFTLGTTPYPGCSWTHEFVNHLIAGLRLQHPEYGTDEIFHLMMDCMKKEPSKRVTFVQIGERLRRIQSNFNMK